MKEFENYRQCQLERPVSRGRQVTTSWIPDIHDYCKPGSVLNLRDINETWTDGWIVKSVGPPMKKEVAESNSRNYLKQRKASDVVFAKIKAQNVL